MTSLSPWLGPVSGGTVVTVHGTGFVLLPNNEATCQFGSLAPVPATIQQVGANVVVVCTSPPAAAGWR